MNLLRKSTNVSTSKLSRREQHLISVMHVLSDSTRYKMFKIILSGEERCVSEVASAVDISVPAASQHFRIFELAGFVYKRRYGQKVCYTLDAEDDVVKDIVKLI